MTFLISSPYKYSYLLTYLLTYLRERKTRLCFVCQLVFVCFLLTWIYVEIDKFILVYMERCLFCFQSVSESITYPNIVCKRTSCVVLCYTCCIILTIIQNV